MIMTKIAAIAFTQEYAMNRVSVKYREIRTQADELMFDLAAAIYEKTAQLVTDHGFDAEARQYHCRNLKSLEKAIKRDYTGRDPVFAVIPDVPEEHARITLEKLPTYGDDFIGEAIRIGASEHQKPAN